MKMEGINAVPARRLFRRDFWLLLIVSMLALVATGRWYARRSPQLTAQEARDAKHYERTVGELKALVKANPKDAEARRLLGFAYLMRGAHLEAVEELDTAVDLGAQDAHTLQELARAYQRFEQNARSLECLQKRKEIDSNNPEAYFDLIELHRKLGDTRAALALLKQMPVADGTSQLWLRIAETYGNLGDSATAVELIEKKIPAPRNLQATRILGWCLLGLDRPLEARRQFERALLLDANDPISHFWLGRTYAKHPEKSEHAKAIPHLKKALQLSPELGPAAFLMGRLFEESGDFGQAVLSYQAAVRLNAEKITALDRLAHLFRQRGDNFNEYLSLGLAHRERGDYSDAAQELERALAKKPSELSVYRLLAETYRMANQPRKSVKVYDRALGVCKTDRQRIAIYRYLEGACEVAGEYDRQREVLESLLKLIPEKSKDRTYEYGELAMCALRNYQYEDAESYFQKAIELRPSGPAFHYMLGFVYLQRPKPELLEKARRAFERAIALEPMFPEAFFRLGIACEKLERWEEASAAYHQALNLEPGYGECYWRLGTLYMQQKNEKWAKRILGLHTRYEQFRGKLETLRITVRERPQDHEARFALANYYYQSGYLAQAEEEFRALRQMEPDSARVREALMRIYTQSGRVSEREAIESREPTSANGRR